MGTIKNKTQLWLEKIGVEVRVKLMPKTVLIGTARMLRKAHDA